MSDKKQKLETNFDYISYAFTKEKNMQKHHAHLLLHSNDESMFNDKNILLPLYH